METQAETIGQFLTSQEIKSLYLCGHDFGGPVAITLMHLFPDLHINGLVLSDTNMFADTYSPTSMNVRSIAKSKQKEYNIETYPNLFPFWMSSRHFVERTRLPNANIFTNTVSYSAAACTNNSCFKRTSGQLPACLCRG